MSDARTTLEVVLKSTGFVEGTTAIKNLGTEATNTNAKLKTTTSTVDQVSKSTTSLGSKLKNAGSQFAGTITSVAALGSTVVNLSRQYQDLSDTQIRVDKTQLKVSRTAEAVRAAQTKLNTAVSQYGKSSAQAQQAQLDLNQAQEASTLAVTMNGEALEDQQRAYENFFMGLAPTILTAGSSITSMFKEMGGSAGGTGGIGGIASKLKSLPASLNMSTKSFAGMAGAIGLAGVAAADLFDLLSKSVEIKALNDVIMAGKATIAELEKQLQNMKDLKGRWDVQLESFFFSGPLGKAIKPETTASVAAEIQKSLESALSRAEISTPIKNALDDAMKSNMSMPDKTAVSQLVTHLLAVINNDNNWKAGYGASENAVTQNTKAYIQKGIDGLINLIATGTYDAQFSKVATGMVGAMRAAFLKANPGAEFGNSPMTKLFAIDPKAIAGPDVIGQVLKLKETWAKAFSGGAFSGKAGANAGMFGEAIEITEGEFKTVATASKTAADKIVADQAAAALAVKQAWDESFAAQTSGIDKMIAAYDKLHPKEKGFSGLGQQKQFDEAKAQLDKLMAGALTKSPAFAKQFVLDFVMNASKTMGPMAGQVFQPIVDYIATHKDDAPDVFMKGFQEVLGKSNPTLAGSMASMLDKNMVQPTTTAVDTVSTTLGKIDTSKAVVQLQKPKVPADLLTKALNAIPKKVAPNVTAKVIGTPAVNAMVKSIAAVKSKTVTISVKPNLDRQLAQVLPRATANVKARYNASGANTTVKRPTMFIAGEGGRPEDVYIKPRGSAGLGPSGGGFSGTINVFVDGVQRPARYSMGARK